MLFGLMIGASLPLLPVTFWVVGFSEADCEVRDSDPNRPLTDSLSPRLGEIGDVATSTNWGGEEGFIVEVAEEEGFQREAIPPLVVVDEDDAENGFGKALISAWSASSSSSQAGALTPLIAADPVCGLGVCSATSSFFASCAVSGSSSFAASSEICGPASASAGPLNKASS